MRRFVLIAGTSFCGSTLLAILLDSHPEVASVSELQGPLFSDPRTYRCSCQETMETCAFWIRVQEEMARRGASFSIERWEFLFGMGGNRIVRHLLSRSLRHNLLDDLRDGLLQTVGPWRRKFLEIGARNEAFVDSILEITGKKVFVDGTKDPVRARFLERFSEIRPAVIHLVRDAPGFVSSNIKNNRASLDASIRNWNRMAGHCTRLFRALPHDRTLRVRYEDLCENPEGELARIASFAGVSAFPAGLDPSTVPHHIIGNRMRLKPLKEISLDHSWRERLTADQVDAIIKRTAHYRRFFGYA